MTMYDFRQFYIDGEWVEPIEPREFDVIDPASEESIGKISLGSAADVDRAATAARRAFGSFAQTSLDQRRDLLQRILEVYAQHYDEIAAAISDEMGAPTVFALKAQAATGTSNLKATIAALEAFEFAHDRGTMRIVREPIGVCGLITPWNWPINQIVCKVAPALAAGCTMVLKPSEIAPLSALPVRSGAAMRPDVPPGVFNLVNGDGPTVGQAICSHPRSTWSRSPALLGPVSWWPQAAAPTVKRVAQELGGKSANIILDDADIPRAVTSGRVPVFQQQRPVVRCADADAGAARRGTTRPPRSPRAAAEKRSSAASDGRGDHDSDRSSVRPVRQDPGADRQGDRGGRNAGRGRPGQTRGTGEGLLRQADRLRRRFERHDDRSRGNLRAGAVDLAVQTTRTRRCAIANDTPYGLSAYVSSGDPQRSRRVALQLRTGQVHINGAPHDDSAPFGGYKQSGNGRECGAWGLEEYLETKALLGYHTK